MKYYLLHRKGVKICDTRDYNKFTYLIKCVRPLNGLSFNSNYIDKDMCFHEVNVPIGFTDPTHIDTNEVVFDGNSYQITGFIEIHRDSNIIVWINNREKVQFDRSSILDRLLGISTSIPKRHRSSTE